MPPSLPPRSHVPLNLGAIGSEVTQPTAAAIRSAEQEADFYASDKKKRGHKRDQLSKDVVHYGMLGITILAALSVAAGAITWTAHQILPTNYCWLDEAHLNHITEAGKLLISGSIGALGNRFLTRNSEPE